MGTFFVSIFLSCLRRAPVMVPSSRQSRCGLRYKRAAGTFALRCGSDFPRLNNPPLETAKKGELRFPLLGTSPRLFSWWSSGGGGLLRNAPAAPACMGGNRGTVLGHRSGLVPHPQMVPPCRGRTLAGLSLPYLPFSTLVGAAFMAARGRPQGSPLPLANNQAPASAPFGADAGANLT